MLDVATAAASACAEGVLQPGGRGIVVVSAVGGERAIQEPEYVGGFAAENAHAGGRRLLRVL
jgi:hypothetical protein